MWKSMAVSVSSWRWVQALGSWYPGLLCPLSDSPSSLLPCLCCWLWESWLVSLVFTRVHGAPGWPSLTLFLLALGVPLQTTCDLHPDPASMVGIRAWVTVHYSPLMYSCQRPPSHILSSFESYPYHTGIKRGSGRLSLRASVHLLSCRTMSSNWCEKRPKDRLVPVLDASFHLLIWLPPLIGLCMEWTIKAQFCSLSLLCSLSHHLLGPPKDRLVPVLLLSGYSLCKTLTQTD